MYLRIMNPTVVIKALILDDAVLGPDLHDIGSSSR